MNLFEWLQSRWSNEAVHYTYLWIRDANVQLAGGAPFVPVTVQAGQHYYRLWLAEMFLKNDRDWGSSWYPAVMS